MMNNPCRLTEPRLRKCVNNELLVLFCVQMKGFPAEMHMLTHNIAMAEAGTQLAYQCSSENPHLDMLKAFCR